jgi:hypothetical protein
MPVEFGSGGGSLTEPTDGDPDRLEPRALFERIWSDRDELEALNVWVATGGDAGGGVVWLELAAPRPEYARELLRERYGGGVVVEWLGPEPMPEVPESWDSFEVLGEQDLLLHYRAFVDAEQSRVAVEETPTQVTLTAYDRQSVGGVKLLPVARVVAVHLSAPLGDRKVLDGAEAARRALNVAYIWRLLDDLKVPPETYRLDGTRSELAHVLIKRGEGWVVFRSEGSGESDPVEFASEHTACAYLLGCVFEALYNREQISIRPQCLPPAGSGS